MGQHFIKCARQNPLPVGHFGKPVFL
jgi:hypothetical protein